MSKVYVYTFGAGNPQNYTGLSPTFIAFFTEGGNLSPKPSTSEILNGFYTFKYDVGQTGPICFIIDGGATLGSNIRYVSGTLDPLDKLDQQIGYTASSFGSTSVDPGTIFGYVQRLTEFNEGNADFIKSSGQWDIYSRGSSTLLRTKTLTNSVAGVTKV